MLRIVVLISGGGTTLANLIAKQQAGELDVDIGLVVSSNPQARGLEIARRAGIAAATVERRLFAGPKEYGDAIFHLARADDAHLVVMGGFLKLIAIPPDFERKVVNIHPSLIPAHCGQGYYGHKVHEAVLAAGDKISGCTVHYVDNQYDHGPIILQQTVPVLPDDTPDSLGARVFAAECQAYPAALRQIAAEHAITAAGE
ncbi:MAG: phosphoribosylglycinamide formyltransferase [Pirellulales bacterium]